MRLATEDTESTETRMSGFLDDLPDLGFDTPGEPRRPGRLGPKRAPVPPEVTCVEWVSVHCPQCGSGNCPIVDSHSVPIRWHLCSCGHKFKSFETNYAPPDE